jgi:Cytidylate kinase-like family
MIARSPEDLIGEQFRRRQLCWRRERLPPRPLAVALSRLAGARGDEVARRLSASLGYDLFDREIIQQIAHDVQLSERVVSALDERDRSFLTDWLESLAGGAHISTYEYLHHLRMAVGAIARLGAAVIVGRGAHLILGPSEALRVLVVAPREVRIASVAAERGLSLREARRRVEIEEAERRAFLQKHFHSQLEDPEAFDLVVNTHVLGVEGAVEAIKGALSRVAAPGNAA